MALAEIENPFEEGLKELNAGRTDLALRCFERAVKQGETPLACSYLAYCRAKEEGAYREAVAIWTHGKRNRKIPIFT